MIITDWKVYPKPPTKAYRQYVLTSEYESLLSQVMSVVESIDSNDLFTKSCKEKGREGKKLFNPKDLNKEFKSKMFSLGWKPQRSKFKYADGSNGCYEVDFYKDKVAVEMQLGKYAFLSDNVIKLDIFQRKYNLVDLNVIVVPDKKLQQKMSSGVGYYQQIIQRLEDLNYQQPLVVMSIGLNPKK